MSYLAMQVLILSSFCSVIPKAECFISSNLCKNIGCDNKSLVLHGKPEVACLECQRDFRYMEHGALWNLTEASF